MDATKVLDELLVLVPQEEQKKRKGSRSRVKSPCPIKTRIKHPNLALKCFSTAAEAWRRWPRTCRCSLRNASWKTTSCTNWPAKVILTFLLPLGFHLRAFGLLHKWHPSCLYVHKGGACLFRVLILPAYVSWVRFYASYPAKAKAYFHYKALHLGHYAKSFALRDPPSKIGGIGKRNWERSQQQEQEERSYRYCPFLNHFLGRRFSRGRGNGVFLGQLQNYN